ncbi:hypothetical protein Cflav_PD4780 [Pedosphaera parvula Ellin514]|uniref:Uncharacterized protein n=1 Tax=Pedosphaera parvula (strain Ellin514) TaxID=320771 RepID=B9XEM6_PEDPL|nr:hypothetical protein Cflav_PD4780 [Pedosphaera parvula Ellin514]
MTNVNDQGPLNQSMCNDCGLRVGEMLAWARAFGSQLG